MPTINDYKQWLSEVDIDPCDYESPSHLVHTLKYAALHGEECECGFFTTQIANGANNGWIISAEGVENKLHLTTLKQIGAFIRDIEATLCEDMDAEVYASYKHAMKKDD